MSDKTDFQDLASELMDAFTGVPYEIEYQKLVSRYAPGGTVTKVITKYQTRCIQSPLTASELAGGIALVTDLKILIAANELAIIPKPKDIFIHKGRKYTVVNVATDPADALWKIISRD